VRRVLFDKDMPRQLRRDMPEFDIRTVQEEGWGSVKNGELLRRSGERFDVLVTADQRLPKQQNITRFSIGVVVIEAVDTRLPHLQTLLPKLRDAIARIQPGTVIVVSDR
jgi:hypothetical protein